MADETYNLHLHLITNDHGRITKEGSTAKSYEAGRLNHGGKSRILAIAVYYHKLTPARPTTAASSLSAAWSDCIILMNLISSATSSRSLTDERLLSIADIGSG